jgi:acyl carrier protein
VRAALLALPAGPQRLSMMRTHLRQELAKVLRVPARQLALDTPLQNHGLDSIMAVELRNRLEASLGLRLSATLAWTYPSLEALTQGLLGMLEGPGATSQATSPSESTTPAVPIRLTEEQLVAALEEELASSEGKKAE